MVIFLEYMLMVEQVSSNLYIKKYFDCVVFPADFNYIVKVSSMVDGCSD